jgi:hypothetical protein
LFFLWWEVHVSRGANEGERADKQRKKNGEKMWGGVEKMWARAGWAKKHMGGSEWAREGALGGLEGRWKRKDETTDRRET